MEMDIFTLGRAILILEVSFLGILNRLEKKAGRVAGQLALP